MNDDKLFCELVLIHTELLMIEKILLNNLPDPDNYENTLDGKIEAQNNMLENMLNKFTEEK